jgi:hypothetical protein
MSFKQLSTLSVALNHPNSKLECTKSAPKKPSAPARYPQFARQELRHASVNNQEADLERVTKLPQESHATLKPGAPRVNFRLAAELGQTS